MDQNWHVYNSAKVVADYSKRDRLFPPEERVFAEHASAISTARVLDLGVGGGRTTRYLLPRARSYRGIDYAPAMIEACRRNFPECAPEVFAVGDARDLSAEPAGGYDFVLFAYNGIDLVSHDDRLEIFAEVRRVLSPGGLFFFSTHSLHGFPSADADVQSRNLDVDMKVIQRHGWGQLIDHKPDSVTYYIYPSAQREQLETSGFELVEALDMAARPFDFRDPSADWMVHFLCRHKAHG